MVLLQVIPFVANWASVWANQTFVLSTQNSGSLRATACTLKLRSRVELRLMGRVFAEGWYFMRKICAILRKFLFFATFCASLAHGAEQVLRNIPHHTQQAKFAQNAIFCAQTTSCIINNILTTTIFIFFWIYITF